MRVNIRICLGIECVWLGRFLLLRLRGNLYHACKFEEQDWWCASFSAWHFAVVSSSTILSVIGRRDSLSYLHVIATTLNVMITSSFILLYCNGLQTECAQFVFSIQEACYVPTLTYNRNYTCTPNRKLFHKIFTSALPSRAMQTAGIARGGMSVCLSVRLSHSGIVSKRRKLASWFLHHPRAWAF